MSYKARTLFRLLEEINNSLFLPHIQRPFVWKEEEQMIKLFDSLMRNYPIQTLLFWRTKDEIKARKFMEEIEWDADLSDYYDANKSQGGVEKVFVLDGQQRLQTLFAIFSGAICDSDGARSEAYCDITSGAQLDDQGLLYRLKFFAIPPALPWYRVADLVGKDTQKNAEELSDLMNDTLDTLNGSKPDADQESAIAKTARQRQVRRNFSQLTSLLREEKHFWVQELDGVANAYPYKTILDIFVRVNSGGTKLDASDLMFAAMKEGWGEIEEAIEETTELLNGTNLQFDKTFALKCLLVANGRGAEASQEKFTGDQGKQLLADMEANWDRAENAFKQLRDFMQNDLKIYADKVIRTYNSFIPIFDYLFHNPKPDERNRALLRGYHYKAQLFGWYSRNTDGVINALHAIVGKPCPDGVPIQNIKQYFRSRGDYVELHSSHLMDQRLRFILLNLVYVDQMGASPFNVKYKGNEPHVDHIYPQHALRTKLYQGSSDINHLGNFRFVGATDNIRKRAELPANYFSRLRASGVDISKHLLVGIYSDHPSQLAFDEATYISFRDARLNRIWEIASTTVNPESGTA